MTIDWWTLGLQTVNVAILIWLLARFLFRPVSKIIGERQAAAHAALDEAEAARAAARQAQEAERAQTDALAAQRAQMLDTARAEAEEEKRRLLAEARSEIDRRRAGLEADFAKARDERWKALEGEAATLAADIAARAMSRLPDAARIDGFIDGLAESVAALPQPVRAGIGSDGPVTVRAARALTKGEETRLEAALGKVLDRPVTVEIAPAPELLAGLELDATNAIVRNHLRADLDHVTAELTGDD
jgi:F-type H+-transporting ATPase subunit b